MSEKTQLVLVECVSMFRMRYLVEVPIGTDNYGHDKKEWALDTVSMEAAKEFSQQHIGENIISSRVISKEEALVLCDQDNDYARSWSEEQKIGQFFTMKEEHLESV
jgi:hypothetical protein